MPILQTLGEILQADNAVLKRVGITPNKAKTIENTGAPETVPSALPIEIYKGVKLDLTTQYKSIKTSIETLKAELTQLGNHQLWLDWIDQFGEDFNATDNLSDNKKKRLINGVVKDILVNYDRPQKLHRVRVNFRLPVLRSVGEILRADNAVLKRVGITPNKAETIENTEAPETVPSLSFHRYTLGQITRLVNVTST